MPLLGVQDAEVAFDLEVSGTPSLKRTLLKLGSGGRVAKDANQRVVARALHNVSFEAGDGDRIALIGNNGAGKTTLLRLLAGVYEPTRGEVFRRGRIAPLLNIALGINPDLTGRENILLRGLLLGVGKAEMSQLYGEIADFTGLHEYLHLPVRTYSAGMRLRLAFAVSTAVHPDILLMDEWVSAGDKDFMAQAQDRLNSMVDNASVFVLATHSLELARQVCTRGLWLEAGKIKADGPIDEVADAYEGA